MQESQENHQIGEKDIQINLGNNLIDENSVNIFSSYLNKRYVHFDLNIILLSA
jgi:hypothetical protein